MTLIYLLSSENAQSSNYDERIVNEELFASNEIETSLANDFVNQNCFLIERAILGESFANFPLVLKIREIGEDSRQISFEVKDENGRIHRYFVAYEKNQTADLVVITIVSQETVLSGVYNL